MLQQKLAPVLFTLIASVLSAQPETLIPRDALYTRNAAEFRTRNTTSHITEMSATMIIPPVPSGPKQNVSDFVVYPTLGADKGNNILQNGISIVDDPKACVNFPLPCIACALARNVTTVAFHGNWFEANGC